jgi:imidazolonepropionase-like amidohydrolase
MKAALEVAHLAGKRVAGAYLRSSGCQRCGQSHDSIEHATDLDDETLAAMARQGIYYVPTIFHNKFYAANASQFGLPPGEVEEFHDFAAKNPHMAWALDPASYPQPGTHQRCA